MINNRTNKTFGSWGNVFVGVLSIFTLGMFALLIVFIARGVVGEFLDWGPIRFPSADIVQHLKTTYITYIVCVLSAITSCMSAYYYNYKLTLQWMSHRAKDYTVSPYPFGYFPSRVRDTDLYSHDELKKKYRENCPIRAYESMFTPKFVGIMYQVVLLLLFAIFVLGTSQAWFLGIILVNAVFIFSLLARLLFPKDLSFYLIEIKISFNTDVNQFPHHLKTDYDDLCWVVDDLHRIAHYENYDLQKARGEIEDCRGWSFEATPTYNHDKTYLK